MKLGTRLIIIVAIIILFIAVLTVSSADAGENAFGLQCTSGGPVVVFADYYPFKTNQHWMVHPWFIPGVQSNVIARYAIFAPGLDKLEIGFGPTWATKDGVEKIRFVSSELTFDLPLGKGLIWQSYNLGQLSVDEGSSDFGMLRQQIKLGQSRWGIFNQSNLKEKQGPKFFLGASCNLAPLRYLSTCKLFATVNIDDVDENFVGCIIEF